MTYLYIVLHLWDPHNILAYMFHIVFPLLSFYIDHRHYCWCRCCGHYTGKLEHNILKAITKLLLGTKSFLCDYKIAAESEGFNLTNAQHIYLYFDTEPF